MPTVTITPVSMTEAQKEQWRATWLARTATENGIEDPPQVALSRWTEGNADHDKTVSSCLTDAGFEAQPASDGGIDFGEGVPQSQMSAFFLAEYTCESMYTLDPVYSQDWTTDQLNLIFDYWTQFYLPCIEAHGVSVDMSSVPSKESWVAAFHTSERSDWWPDNALQSTPTTQQTEIRKACALYPPDDVFYGQ